jgi:hypothetical protein
MKELEQTSEERPREKAPGNSGALPEKPAHPPPATEYGAWVVVAVAVLVAIAGIVTWFQDDPFPEPPKPTAQMTPAEYTAYFATWLNHVGNYRKRDRYEGLAMLPPVEVAIRISPEGRGDVTFEKSTKDATSDGRYRTLLKLAERFPAPPPTLGPSETIRLRMKVEGALFGGRLVVEPLP